MTDGYLRLLIDFAEGLPQWRVEKQRIIPEASSFL